MPDSEHLTEQDAKEMLKDFNKKEKAFSVIKLIQYAFEQGHQSGTINEREVR